jgi:FkbM family methyltransferase
MRRRASFVTNMIGKLLCELSFEVRRNRLTRLIHHPGIAKKLHPEAAEPEVIKCLVEGNWNGPVWDVGGFMGNLAYAVAQRHKVIVFEPNLCNLYYLGYKLKDTPNVTVVPCALTLEGKPWQASIEPDFTKPAVGPQTITLSVDEALKKFGKPGLIKLDIEGGEYEVIKAPALIGLNMLVEWHRGVPKELEHWHMKQLDAVHTLLTPK